MMISVLRILIFISVLLLSASSAFAQGAKITSRDEIEAAVNVVPCKRDDRLDGVRKQFLGAGAADTDIKIEKFDKDRISNLVVRKKGSTDETVIIGAHYDRSDAGCGAIDNWTGIVVLTQLFRTLAPMKTNKTYVFVAFDKEEVGLRGSGKMVGAMSKNQIEHTCAMVNFDSFSKGRPFALTSASSPKLLDLGREIGKDGGLEFDGVDLANASADSASFKSKGIPAITISGITNGWESVLHTANDKVDNINIDSVYIGYRFGVLLLAKIDAAGCDAYK